MAHVHPVATMCEVTYDSDWYEDDRYMTPYRYSLLRNDTDSNSDTVSLTLPSYTYYEYLRSLYDCRSTALHRHPPGYPVSPGSDRIPERAKTWHEFGSERTSVQASREAAHSEPTKIRPTYPFPSLHLIQQGATSGDESDEDDFWDRSKEKLVWVDALNKWIPEQQLHHRPYLSFVGNPPTVEKKGLPKSTRETPGGGDYIEIPYCERFEQHMGRASVSQRSQPSRQRTNDNKREEIRRRAQEIAEQRRQRKAYSTPLYTSLTERKQKARIQSCKAPASTPVSPVQKTVKAPPPKEVWQSRDTPKTEEKPVPLKKEISIRLLSPKTEDLDSKAAGDIQPTPRDKRVKFQQDKTAKDKQSKTETNEENKNNNARSDSAAAERKLVEALEKQRQQQLAEEQRLLQEQQREKERLARERETQAEKERLEKERERLLELEKDPKKHGLMNSHKQPHENYYESTMNAAGGKRRKGKDGARTQKKKGTKVKKKSEDEDEEKHQEKLQVSSADDLIQEEEPPEPTEEKPKTKIKVKQQPVEDNTPQNPEENGLAYERRKSISQRVKEISLKEKRERPCVKKESKEEKEETLPPPPDSKKVESWIFDDENFSEPVETKQEEEETVDFVAPAISADLTPELVIEEKREKKEKRRTSLIEQKIKTDTKGKKWGKPKKDTSYEDELRRQEIAEERRRRQMEMLERLKGRQMEQFEGQEDDGSPHFEDYGFLSKYCIFTKGNIEMYRHAFDAVDDQHRGWLEGEEVMIALRGVNSKLTEAEEEYMYRILELTGYKLTNGADFKMFSVLAALSQRISALDSWMRNLIGKMDFKMLDMKLFMCKTLWECNVDPDTNKISIDQLCVDLRAGGVSLEHEFEVRNKLSHLDALDLLDFLTYVPLFIMIHESVVENPLSDIREK